MTATYLVRRAFISWEEQLGFMLYRLLKVINSDCEGKVKMP